MISNECPEIYQVFERKRTLSLLWLIFVWIRTGIAAQMLAREPVAQQEEGSVIWAGFDSSGRLHVDLYFFWTNGCPHFARARPFIESLAQRSPWLNLHSLPPSGHSQNVALFIHGRTHRRRTEWRTRVLFCSTALVGYDNDAITSAYLDSVLNDCLSHLLEN